MRIPPQNSSSIQGLEREITWGGAILLLRGPQEVVAMLNCEIRNQEALLILLAINHFILFPEDLVGIITCIFPPLFTYGHVLGTVSFLC